MINYSKNCRQCQQIEDLVANTPNEEELNSPTADNSNYSIVITISQKEAEQLIEYAVPGRVASACREALALKNEQKLTDLRRSSNYE
jgi:hypothetical protein